MLDSCDEDLPHSARRLKTIQVNAIVSHLQCLRKSPRCHMKMLKFQVCLSVVAHAALFLSVSVFGQSTQGRKVLPRHVPPAVAHLQPVGRLSATTNLSLAIGLPLRDPQGLTNFLNQLYDPASKNYHHYLSSEEFTERFGPTQKDYQTVTAFLQTNGFKVTATHPNRLLIDVAGSVPTIEKTFGVTLRLYPHPTENRTFYSPDSEPSVPAGIPILDIS